MISGFVAVAPAASAAVGVVIRVAPTGVDDAAGTPETPIATLEEAQKRVRLALAAGQVPTVELSTGVYSLKSTLKLTAADSGSVAAPVIWRAVAGAKPIVRGGQQLSLQWFDYRNGIKVANLPDTIDSDQLFVNGQRQIMARYPNFQPGQILDGYSGDATSPTRTKTWSDPTTGYIRGIHSRAWGGNSYQITGRNSDGTLTTRWVGDNQRGSGLNGDQKMVENIFEELDAPGEWFHDRKTGKLYYMPAANVDMATATFSTAELSELVRVEGSTASAPAHDIEFRGITFTGTHRTLFTGTFEPISLSDWSIVRQGAIVMRNTERVNVRDSRFDQVGGNALFVDGYAKGNLIDNNEFVGSGASDVAIVGRKEAVRNYSTWGNEVRTITDLTPGPKTQDYPRDVTVSNNLMTQMGRFEKQVAGVEISIAQGIKVLRNTIHDGPRAGINIGDGTWGGHVIQGNDLYNLVKETGDHGPINAWGRDRFWPAKKVTVTDPATNASKVVALDASNRKTYAFLDAMTPTKIDNNRIWHKGYNGDGGRYGIDLDDGSSNYVLTNNLLRDTGIKLREGYKRVVENNIFVDDAVQSHASYNDNNDVIRRNVFFGQAPYGFAGGGDSNSTAPFDNAKVDYNNNVFYNNGNGVSFNRGAASVVVDPAWIARGHDENSAVANPKPPQNPWANPSMLDYTLAADSPALARGFVNFSMSSFGKPGFTPEVPPVRWNSAPVVPTRESLAEPWLGANVTGIYSPDIASSVGLSLTSGLYLASVPNGTAAASAGLYSGDVIRSVNGSAVTDKNSFWQEWNVAPAGSTVTFGVWRNQEPVTITLARPAGTEKINNTSGITYTGTGWDWKESTRGGAGAYLSEIDATNKSSSGFSFSFSGNRLKMSTQKNSDETQFEIRIDNRAWTRIDLNNGSRVHQQQVYDSGILEAKTHTVEVRNVGVDGKWLVVDSFQITR